MLLNCGVGEDSLRVPWTARRSNQSILKEISPGFHWRAWCWSWNSKTLAFDAKSWLIWKDPDAGKDWGQEEKGTTENEMLGWHHWHSGHGSGWTLGVGDGQRSLACCSLWGRKESDMTEQLNNNMLSFICFPDSRFHIRSGTSLWFFYLGRWEEKHVFFLLIPRK